VPFAEQVAECAAEGYHQSFALWPPLTGFGAPFRSTPVRRGFQESDGQNVLSQDPVQTDGKLGLSGPNRRLAMQSTMAMLMLTACGRPPDLIGIDNPKNPVLGDDQDRKHTIFIASTRQATEVVGALYGKERAPELSLASVVVHVPPNHVLGKLERPRRMPPNPDIEFAGVDPTIYASDDIFIRELDAELAKRPVEKRDILVFVHGYNTTTSDAILRLGQFVEDTGYKGVTVLLTWASGGQLTKYVYDINSVMVARPMVAKLADILAKTTATGFDVFAHSMGAMLIMESIVDVEARGTFDSLRRLKTIVLASPDIDIDLFESQLSRITAARKLIYVLVSDDDGALRISWLLSGGVARLGATDADRVAAFDVNVIDLTQIDDSTTGSHTKFSGSPEVVQLIGQGLNSIPGAMIGSSTFLGGLLDGLPIRVIRN
jgi:esterase/lipase superfamily enzyme